MAKRKRVALLIEPWTSFGRNALRGIARFTGSQQNWMFDFEHAAASGFMARNLPEGLDGIIARIADPEVGEVCRGAGIPVVNISDSLSGLEFCATHSDELAVGRMAGNHLLERGFEHYGVVGLAGIPYSQKRMSGFQRLIEAHGHECDVLELSGNQAQGPDRGPRIEAIRQWLAGMQHPVGIFAVSDEIGRHVCEACRAGEWRVPEDVAVIGVDDDDVLCELSNPALSSVALNAAKIGYTAAHLLKQLMDGRRVSKKVTLIDPMGLTVRRSTQTVAVDDPVVTGALEHIWQHAAEGLNVEDLVEHVEVSRRWLEVRFRRALGRSPAAEIRRAKIERAKKLLVETDLMVPDIADASGFSDAKVMIAVFRRELETTPTAYRRTHRLS
jgi:LacI family transcriptional regulator